MKKVFFMVMAVAALTFVSCGNKQNPATNNADSTEVQADTMVVAATDVPENAQDLTGKLSSLLASKDAKGITAMLTGAQAKAVELAKNNPEKAKEYLLKVQEWLKSNAEKIKTVATNTGNSSIATALTSAATTMTSVSPDAVLNTLTNGAKIEGDKLVNSAKDDAAAVKEAASNQVNDAQNEVKKAGDQVQTKTNEAVKKANEATKKAGETAGKAVKKTVNKATNEALKGLGL